MLTCGMKRMKRASHGSAVKKAKHKVEYDTRWKEEFPWHVPVWCDRSVLFCLSLPQYVTMLVLGPISCVLTFSRIKVEGDTEAHEAERLSSQRDGGIVQAFSARVMIDRKALIGA